MTQQIQPGYAFWMTRTARRVYAIRTDGEGRVNGYYGPLFRDEARFENLAGYRYIENGVEVIEALSEEFRIVEPRDLR